MSCVFDELAAVAKLEKSIWMTGSCLVVVSAVVFGVVVLEVEWHSLGTWHVQ